MFIIRNSIKNIHRYKKKYLPIGIVYFIIVLIAYIIVCIYNYSSMTIDVLKMKYASTVTVSRGNTIDIQNFNQSDYMLFNNCEYVDEVNFNSYIISSISLGQTQYDITEEHKAFYSEAEYEVLLNKPQMVETQLEINGEIHKIYQLNINPIYIMGYNYETLPEEYKERFILESGRMYESNNECVIVHNPYIPNEEWNLLNVGDKIQVKIYDGRITEYIVTGILQADETITAETKTRVLFTTFESAAAFRTAVHTGNLETPQVSKGPVNNPIEPTMGIQTTGNTYNEFIEQYEVSVVLKTYNDYDEFLRYLKSLGGYYCSPLYANFSTIISVLNQYYAWSIVLFIIITIILIFMTVFTTIFNLDTRKYEIAVLRSIGMKKKFLIITYLTENIIFIWGITTGAIIIAHIIQPIIIEKIFNNMNIVVSSDMTSSITSTTNLNLLLQNIGIVFGCMTVTVILSLFITCINIMKFQPLKILIKHY